MCKTTFTSPVKMTAKNSKASRRPPTPMPKRKSKNQLSFGANVSSMKSLTATVAASARRLLPRKKFTYKNCPIKPKSRGVREAPMANKKLRRRSTKELQDRLESARRCLAVAIVRLRKAREAMKEFDGFFASIFRDARKEAAAKKRLRDAKTAVSYYRAKFERETEELKGRGRGGTKTWLEECSDKCEKASQALKAAEDALYDAINNDDDDVLTHCFSLFGVNSDKVRRMQDDNARKEAAVVSAKKAYQMAYDELKIAQEEAKSACEEEINAMDATSSEQENIGCTSEVSLRDFRDWPILMEAMDVVLKATFRSECDPSQVEVPARALNDLFTVLATSEHKYLLCSERLAIQGLLRVAMPSRQDSQWMELPEKHVLALERIARSRGQLPVFCF